VRRLSPVATTRNGMIWDSMGPHGRQWNPMVSAPSRTVCETPSKGYPRLSLKLGCDGFASCERCRIRSCGRGAGLKANGFKNIARERAPRGIAGRSVRQVKRRKIRLQDWEGESVSRPVSRVLYGAARMPHATTIHLGRPLPDASRNQPGRLAWKRAGILADPAPPLFGFAPGGVYRAASVTGRAVGSYPTLSPLPRPKPGRFAFCGTFPGVAPAGRYPAPFFRGARTFLPRGVSALAGAAVRPADARLVGVQAGPVKPCRDRPPPAPTRLPRRSRAHPPPPVRQSR
jgi:hypothetical protein